MSREVNGALKLLLGEFKEMQNVMENYYAFGDHIGFLCSRKGVRFSLGRPGCLAKDSKDVVRRASAS